MCLRMVQMLSDRHIIYNFTTEKWVPYQPAKKGAVIMDAVFTEAVIVKKFHPGDVMEYPTACLPESFFSEKVMEGNEDVLDLPQQDQYNGGEFGISHFESLDDRKRSVRGLVKYKDQQYVFTARVDLTKTMLKVDLTKIMDVVVGHLKEK